MRRRLKLTLATGIAVALATVVVALAYFTSAGTGTGTAAVGTLAATTITNNSATGNAVSLTWSAVTLPASGTVSYYALRDGGAAGGNCGSAASPITTLTCTDDAPGSSSPTTYSYVVVAVWRSWKSTSASVSQFVKGDQTITFTSTAPANAKVAGPTYTVTATGGGSGNPVTFTSGTPSVCTSSGTNGATITFVGAGTCTINANQAGNANYNAAPQAQQTFTVAKGDQTITFTSTAPSNAKVGGATYTVTATGGASGNAVTFSIDATATSVCSISGSTVSFTAVGTCKVNANQAGNANYNAAPQAQQSFAVAKGDQTITFTSTAPSNAKVGGATYTVTATGGASGNAVTFSIDATATSVCSISGSTVSFTAVGTCKVNANQAGNANYNAAPQAQQTFTVAKGDQTITFTSTAPSNATVGGATYTATATASSGLTPVTFTSGSTSVCTSGGTNGATFTFVGAGTCIVNANQAGDTNWNAAPQAQQSFSVASAASALVTYTSTGTAQTWSSTTAKAVSYPAGTSANDLLFLVQISTGNAVLATPTGWTLLASQNKGSSLIMHVWWKLAAGGADTSVSLTAQSGATAWVIRYVRPSGYPPNPSTATATVQSGSANGGTSLTPTMVTTNAANATAISFVGQASTSTLSLGTPQGFTRQNGLPGSSVVAAFADRVVASAGTPTAPTWTSPTNADWVFITVAFK